MKKGQQVSASPTLATSEGEFPVPVPMSAPEQVPVPETETAPISKAGNDPCAETEGQAQGQAQDQAQDQAQPQAEESKTPCRATKDLSFMDSVRNISAKYCNHAEMISKEERVDMQALGQDIASLSTDELRQLVMNSDSKILSGVPGGVEGPLTPTAYCSECVSRVVSYLSNYDLLSDAMFPESELGERQGLVFIKDPERAARNLLDMLKLSFQDHISIRTMNGNYYKRCPSHYSMPLDMASLLDKARGKSRLFEKLAGEEVASSLHASGIVMDYNVSDNTMFSDNTGEAHELMLLRNTINSRCSCMKSDEWLAVREEESEKLKLMIDRVLVRPNPESSDHSLCSSSFMSVSSNPKPSHKRPMPTEPLFGGDFKEEECLYSLLPDYAYATLGSNEQKFNDEAWKCMRSSLPCLSLCRHSPNCPNDKHNWGQIMSCFDIVRLKLDSDRAQAEVLEGTDGNYYSMIPSSTRSIIISLGSTVYEATVRPVIDSENLQWGEGEEASSFEAFLYTGVFPGFQNTHKTPGNVRMAKALVTVNTVASLFCGTPPIHRLRCSNDFGTYHTRRIRLPADFTGRRDDTSLSWRSLMYTNLAVDAAKMAARSTDKHLCRRFFDDGGSYTSDSWKVDDDDVHVECTTVCANAGDYSGNFLRCDFKKYGMEKYVDGAVENFSAVQRHIRQMTGRINETKILLAESLDRAALASKSETTTQHEWTKIQEEQYRSNFLLKALTKYRIALKHMELDQEDLLFLANSHIPGFRLANNSQRAAPTILSPGCSLTRAPAQLATASASASAAAADAIIPAPLIPSRVFCRHRSRYYYDYEY
uniref:Wsv260-like protein n=1 Tax=Sicyonia whispovirus TaxID=2984283 RepID=A0A9C7F0V7_9VIRU|nr:MAG: wsv260-like protein [Sicyonia whispovirus]